MRVLFLHPPNFTAIQRAFNVRGKPILFCYGNTIYNPGRVTIPPELMVHESVHSTRQGNDPKSWWKSYIADRSFRLNEEIPAHRAEFQYLREHGRADQLDVLAARLASWLYGAMIDETQARKLIGDP